MSDLFPISPQLMKPRRPKPPRVYIRAAFNRKIERPKTTFEFDDALDVLPPGKDMRPRQKCPHFPRAALRTRAVSVSDNEAREDIRREVS